MDRPGSRGRIVMLVDNGVRGDSRVQKAAESAASAGWEVFLLGTAAGRGRHRWDLGHAKVRLLPQPKPLHVRRHLLRGPLLRRPLAYPNPRTAAYQRQWIKAWRAELRVRRDRARIAAREARSPLTVARARLTRAWLKLPGAASRARAYWVELRERQRLELERRRSTLDAPLDRMAIILWTVLLRGRAWRRLEPHLLDYDLAFAREIHALRPDIIHAHDFRMLGVGAHATVRLRAEGRRVKLLWDAHEYVPGVRPHTPRWQAGVCGYERRYAREADAVVTVSDTLAEMLQQRHRLPERPEVVLNAPAPPPQGEDHAAPVPDLRELCGVGEDTPLLVYSGVVAPQRGIATVVEGLAGLPGTHAAVVAPDPPSRHVHEVLRQAEELGVADRLHVLPYVPYWQIVPFLSPANAGVIPIHHWPNHELALITKFFEYAHARLPLIVSDVRTMAHTTRQEGIGEVFRAEDTEDYVRAAQAVLADPGRYRAAYDRPELLEKWTWEAQARKLDRLYARLLEERPGRTRETVAVPLAHPGSTAPVAARERALPAHPAQPD